MLQGLGAAGATQGKTGSNTGGWYLSIASKGLIPIVISAAIFGRYWSGKLVNFRVDNLGVIQVLQATYCRDTHLMHLINRTQG